MKFRQSLLTMLCLSILLICAGPAGASFSNVVAFGDSLTDGGPANGHGFGRFTEPGAKIWVEHVAEHYSASLHNFAWGGATTGIGNLDPFNWPNLDRTTGLLWQVNHSDASEKPETPSGPVNPVSVKEILEQLDMESTLFTVWAGGNDFAVKKISPNQAAANIAEAIRVLADKGAKHVLVANLGSFVDTPRYQFEQHPSINGFVKWAAEYWVEDFNLALVKELKKLVFDGKIYFLDVKAHLDQFGPDIDEEEWLDRWTLERNGYPDGFHPSELLHKEIADNALLILSDVWGCSDSWRWGWGYWSGGSWPHKTRRIRTAD